MAAEDLTAKEYYFGFKGKLPMSDFIVSGIFLPILILIIGVFLSDKFYSEESTYQIIPIIITLSSVILAGRIFVSVLAKRMNDLEMTAKEYYFGFKGKLPRKDFWLSGILFPNLMIGISSAIHKSNYIASIQTITSIIAFAFIAFAIWIHFSILAKRMNDLEMHKYKIFLSLIPFVNIFFWIYVGFVKDKNFNIITLLNVSK